MEDTIKKIEESIADCIHVDLIDGIFGYYEQGKPYNPTFVTKYVHELQHALKLCGIEKTIEL